MAASDLTAQRLRELLNYDPLTGLFTWAVSRVGVKKGKVAGSPHNCGYITIRVELGRAYAHRLAWLHVYGEWPQGDIDHINGIRADNRIANLRDVSRSVNLQNQRGAKSHNLTSGLLGVSKGRGNWVAAIGRNGKRIYIGTFNTPQEAHSAYLAAKREMHPGCTI